MNKPNVLAFTAFPVLTTARLTLREVLLSDAPDVLVFRGDAQVQKYNGPIMQNVGEVQDLIREVRAETTAQQGITWAVTLTGSDTVLGLFGFHDWDKCHRRAEISYDLAPRYLWVNLPELGRHFAGCLSDDLDHVHHRILKDLVILESLPGHVLGE